MNVRERWTVYPLLFLTLGLVMRDRVDQQGLESQRRQITQIAVGQVSMNRLVILDEKGDPAYSLTEEGWLPEPPRRAGDMTFKEFFRQMGEKNAGKAPGNK